MIRSKQFRCKCSDKIHPIPASILSGGIGLCMRMQCPDCKSFRYQCKLCQTSSGYKSNINRHIRVHHATAADSPALASMQKKEILREGTENHDSTDFDNTDEPSFDPYADDDDDGSVSSICDDVETEESDFLMNLIDLSTEHNNEHGRILFDYQALATSSNTSFIKPSDFPFEDDNRSREYFMQEYMHKKSTGQSFGGIKGLTWRCINQVHSYKEQNMLEIDDAKLMFLLADHALNNNGKQKEVFFKIIDGLVNRLKCNNNNNNSLESFVELLDDEQKMAFNSIVSSMNEKQTQAFQHMKTSSNLQIKAPRNTNEANQLFLQGRFSIFSNIPNAAVRILADHAVVSLDSLFDHIMAQGIPIMWKQDENGVVNNTTINGSPAASKLHNEFKIELGDSDNTALGLILVWSDGFLRVYVKQKKNSTWIMTIALPNPAGNATSIFHTYCIAVGNSSSDHTPVMEYFLRELELVKQEKVRYCGLSGSFVKTSFRMLAYSSDRIERGDLLKTSIGGTYGLRSHFASGFDPDRFPFCDRCFNKLVESLNSHDWPCFPAGDDSCQVCCRWDSQCTTPASMSVKLPDKYPKQASSSAPPPPANRSIIETHVVPMRQTFSWLKQGLEFAHHNLITEERNAEGKRKRWTKDEAVAFLRTMGVNEKVQDDTFKSAKFKRENPIRDTIPYIPALWKTNILMERFLNSPMHLLFHGLVAGVMELLHRFVTLLSKVATFERTVNKHLVKIETLRLDWLKLRELPNTKWLAENLLAMTRIMPAVYGTFFNIFSVPPIYSKAAKSLKQTINTLHVLVSTLMSPRCSFSDSKRLDMYIKMFLSTVHRSAKLILGDSKGDAWLTNKANPVSLLNLTNQLEDFGPVRWYYEGVCERYIQVFKPLLIKNMRRTPSYYQQKLILLHKMVFMKWLTKCFEKEEIEEYEDDCQMEYKGYYRYQTYEFVRQEFDSGAPISCLKLDIGPRELLWIAFGRSQSMSIVPVIASGNAHNLCGCSFFQFTLLEDKQMNMKRTELEQHVCCYGLLFPLIQSEGNPFVHKFTCTISDWDVLTQKKTKDEPVLDSQLFAETNA